MSNAKAQVLEQLAGIATTEAGIASARAFEAPVEDLRFPFSLTLRGTEALVGFWAAQQPGASAVSAAAGTVACQVDSRYLLGNADSDGWVLKAKLLTFVRPRKQLAVDFLIDTGCTFDAIVPCRKAEQLGLQRCGEARAQAYGNSLVTIYRYTPCVEIFVPMWLAGLESTDGRPAEVKRAWIEVWGDELDRPSESNQAIVTATPSDADESTGSSSVSSDIGDPSSPTRQYEGIGMEQFSPLTHSRATAILGLSAISRLRLTLDAQHRRLMAITSPMKVLHFET